MLKQKLKRPYEYLTYCRFLLSPSDTLKSIHIQLTNTCNLRCKWCSFVNPKEKQMIDKSLLDKFFEQLLAKGKFPRIAEINLWNGGEALLHKDFVGLLKVIKYYKCKYSSSFLKIKLLTNAMLLTKDISNKLIEINAIDYIGFSIDGGSKKEFEKIRVGAKFNVIKKNIKYFLKINKGKIETMINCIVPFGNPLNSNWMTQEFKELLESVDFYKLNYLVNNGGDLFIDYPKDFKFRKTNKRVCLALLQGLVLLQNGDVLFCCDDFNGKYILGNLNKQSLIEIANSKKRKNLVKIYFKHGKKAIPLCSTCNRFEVPYKIWNK